MIIGIIYKVILFFPLIKSFILSRKRIFSAQNYIFIYLLVTTINEWVSFTRNVINPDVKVGLQYNFYFIFCIIFFYFFYSKIFTAKLNIISSVVTISTLIYIIFSTDLFKQEFDKRIGIVITLFYIVNCLLWFYQKITLFDKNKITDDPVFWISTALLMWSCFFIFRVTPMFFFAKSDNEFLQFLKTGQNIINIIMYSMFYISLTKYKKKLNR
ncbi:hypothetical protein BCF50_3088 [Chryseobacterium daecheongense]|uniref:Uncharacterized protein n=1 Tax=Chryseobacterium daecheongense TaxID=192389 RepID=A0A3N0VSF3_9FLAO|nr:hypothetical protein EGI05_14155 [Chryseobacterium daecheongense]TDX91946.1 hypothetical protein BCF50_3088 [Chryseobacterium daecheongense]